MKNLTILLLQARHVNDLARREERQSFADRMALDLDQVVPYDLLTGAPSLEEVRRHDALMVGGSGDYYVSKGNLPDFKAVLETLGEAVDLGQPIFASCFGFQMLVHALGGQIGFHPEAMEVGSYRLSLTEAAATDELFGALPPTFMAQLGHKDRADRLPDGAVNLAFSELAPFQAMRIPGKPVWATQFHPEMTGEENRLRFSRYVDGYAKIMTPEELEAALNRFYPSPEADGLLARFLAVVFG